MLCRAADQSNTLSASIAHRPGAGAAMRLSDYTDYTLRVLMYCAAQRGRLVTIAEIAEVHGLSKNHLMKIVNDLSHQGLLETTRGRGGGLRLLKAPEQIRIGDVLRQSETDFRLVECFDAATDTCTLTAACRLRGALVRAQRAWFAELDALTLADVVPLPPSAAMPPPARRLRIRPA
jgi:Rrf2 family transcriptional regulator, nitric oxide-sensitive transcriptional repressor